jgi:hypothetical protein
MHKKTAKTLKIRVDGVSAHRCTLQHVPVRICLDLIFSPQVSGAQSSTIDKMLGLGRDRFLTMRDIVLMRVTLCGINGWWPNEMGLLNDFLSNARCRAG